MTGRILLTGARGFLGRQIMVALQTSGMEVVALHRAHAGRSSQPDNRLERYTQDLFAESPERLEYFCDGIDTVVHSAWYVEPGKYLHSDRNLECVTGTLKLAQAAMKSGVRRFVGIGTCLEYELSDSALSVDTPLRPRTPYAAAKAASFMLLSSYLAEHEVEFAWCRVFYLFGENEDPSRLFSYVHGQLKSGAPVELTSGQQVRDYLDVQLAGKMIADIAKARSQGAFNICSGEPKTIRQHIENLADGYNARHLLRFGAKPDRPGDPPCIWGQLR